MLKQVDTADSKMIELVEMEIQEMITEMRLGGEETPVIKGNTLSGLKEKNPQIRSKAILELLESIDSHVPVPVRSQ